MPKFIFFDEAHYISNSKGRVAAFGVWMWMHLYNIPAFFATGTTTEELERLFTREHRVLREQIVRPIKL
jgi:hypothetical protein